MTFAPRMASASVAVCGAASVWLVWASADRGLLLVDSPRAVEHSAPATIDITPILTAPFFGRPPEAAARAARNDIVLDGIASAAQPGAAFAFLRVNGAPLSAALGEEIAPGVVLSGIAPDHVTLTGPQGARVLGFSAKDMASGAGAQTALSGAARLGARLGLGPQEGDRD